MKLLLKEPEHEALRVELSRWEGYASSALLGTEAIRACARYGEVFRSDARAWLESVALIPVDDAVLSQAASLGPRQLRTLDALHLATALSVRGEIAVFATYDQRLAGAAADRGFEVLRPG